MLYTKFRRNRSTGSRKEDFKCFTIYGYRSHHGHVTSIIIMKVKVYKDQELKKSEPKSSPRNQNGK